MLEVVKIGIRIVGMMVMLTMMMMFFVGPMQFTFTTGNHFGAAVSS